MTNPIRTDDQITQEIIHLKALRVIIPHYNGFGDDNWKAINAQIWVLEEKADDSEIDDEWPDEDQIPQHDSAYDAFEWLYGYSNEPPSVDWQGLAKS